MVHLAFARNDPAFGVFPPHRDGCWTGVPIRVLDGRRPPRNITMRLSSCGCCGQMVFFESVSCTRCETRLGFAPDRLRVLTLEEVEQGLWREAGAGADAPRYRDCANHMHHAVCNWLVRADDPRPYCIACRLNRTIPDLSQPGNLLLWGRIEVEKRRLVYGLLRLGLPVAPRSESPDGLAFDFLADEPDASARVLTGHASGLITLNIAEADPLQRERMRTEMGEPYRTLIGHFRHESGHYYWDRLVRDTGWLGPCRELFGDERADYAQALRNNYEQGPPVDWEERFVSSYASSHPWEDWAETWAHYLHIVDTLETAHQFGLGVRPRIATDDALHAETIYDPFHQDDFASVIEDWLPLTYALNSLNRSMGHDHVYPFVLAPPVIAKLGFVHRIVQEARIRSYAANK
jgi:hypothetical protein